MGFWDYTIRGVSTPSKKWMTELLQAQKQGKEPDNKERLRLNAAEITKQYPEDSFPGHSAWLDWPYKLHRIQKKGPVRFELYNLANDPMEAKDLLDEMPDRAETMKASLNEWLVSVVQSLNGKDYK
jgi:hypothetical protein